MGNTQSFSGIAPIALSRCSSGETLIEVQLCYRRPSQIEVFLLWKTEYLDCCITTMRVCCKKGGYCGR